jgi:hypothetical protein
MSGKIISVSIRRNQDRVEVVATQGLFSTSKVDYLATLKQFPCSSSG